RKEDSRMLTALRNSAQSWYVKVLLGIIAVSFVLAFGVVGGLSNTKEVLVEVDGTEILVNDFLRLYQRELERLQERFPENA
ncbi:MAG: hypothetical protein GWO39_10540, partial [Gammaproteobacteria bacterium]|nr:hypothetical protein [Gammaproteobacteria bacterium]NIT64195.1 hypothetical protein [Gammaproteobacteria bacterium]NIV21138.1 hypothetical protein [Gammaproteobacteria bacterium]NIY32775.1 hypothetical protein [Gammaproteobacteria bacterium]